MIRSIMKRGAGTGQRGGVAILTALGFLLFSVPLITGSLGLASTIGIDDRVKTEILHKDYCALAVEQYLSYLAMDAERWEAWLLDNPDPDGEPGTYIGTEDLGCETITIKVIQLPPSEGGGGDPVGFIPGTGYNQRNFQTSKTVSNPNPFPGASVIYTITVQNRNSTATTLNGIRDILPPVFSYDCNALPDQLTLPGSEPQDIVPKTGPCPVGSDIEWTMASGTSIEPGDEVTLTFTAKTSLDDGVYCNEAQVVPSQEKTSSGKTAVVQIGEPAAQPLCPGEAVVVSQTMDSADLVSTNTDTTPFTYNVDIDYTITVSNIGTLPLTLAGLIDLLPEGFSYDSISDGDITVAPSQLQQVSQLDRQKVTWDFSPQILIEPGTAKTLRFSTTAVIGQGYYWVDLLAQFAGGSFPEQIYTWPTALFRLRDVYDVTVTTGSGTVVLSAQVWLEGAGGGTTWDIP